MNKWILALIVIVVLLGAFMLVKKDASSSEEEFFNEDGSEIVTASLETSEDVFNEIDNSISYFG